MKLTELSKLPWLDQSASDPVEKARRVLNSLVDESPAYFFDDGFPRTVVREQVANVLAVLNALAAHPVADAAENFTLTVQDGAHIPNADERAAFEEWAEHPDDPLDLSPSGQWFMDPDTNLAWSAYQAGVEWQRKQNSHPSPDAADTAEKVTRLRRALYQIAHWPDGGNAYGQAKIKRFAIGILDGDPPTVADAAVAPVTDEQIDAVVLAATKHISDAAIRLQTDKEIRALLAAVEEL